MKGWLTGEQVARRLKRHPDLVYRWLREGRLKGVKVGDRLWMIDPREIARFKADMPKRRKRGPE